MTSPFNAGRPFAFVALIAVLAMVAGCDSFSGIVPTSDATNTGPAEAQQAAPRTNGPSAGGTNQGMEMSGQMPGAGGMEMPGADGVEMAEMMMGEGELAVPDGSPDDSGRMADFARQLGSTIPGDEAPDAAAGTEAYVNQPGGIGLDPAVGDGAPGDLATASAEYLKSAGGGPAGPAQVPGGPGQSPGIPGGQRPRGNAAGKPAPPTNPSAIGTKLRNKNGSPAPGSRPTPPRTSGAPKTASGGKSPAPSFTQQPLFRLSNPVCLFDGTGFSISFSVDYQLLRAPEPGVTYLWVVSFEELDKSGQGSSIKKIQQAFKPTESSTLRVIVPLKGKPKEPYRCVIAAKKGNQIKQVSKSTTFPPTFK